MVKKAQRAVAKTKKVKAAQKDGTLAATATRVGRTLGRAAKGVDKVKALAKKSASARRARKKSKIDPDVEATRARNRVLWKSQEQEATSIELAKRGALVDERARVRATMGMSWSNRKPR